MNSSLTKLSKGFLSGTSLKIFALLCMTTDHIGSRLLPADDPLYLPFRIVGRLAFPIFAYMIAEGCRYTHHKLKYFFCVMGLGVICQIFYIIYDKSLSFNILISLGLSILIIYVMDLGKNSYKYYYKIVTVFFIFIIYFITELAPVIFPQLKEAKYHFDYGFFGIMLPVATALFEERRYRLLMFSLGLVALSISLSSIQWWCLLSIIPIALYSGERGKYSLKYVFYLYYPLHLLVIQGIKYLIES